MKKQWQLIRVMLKCGRVGKSESKSSAVGDASTLFSMLFGAAVMVAMFFGGRYAAEHQAILGDASTVFTAVMLLSGVAAFFMTIINVMNQLYISSDLDVLVTLPFTPMQIVVGKLICVSTTPAAICCGVTIPGAIGYMTMASGLSPMFLPSLIIGSLLMTVYVVSAAAIIMMIIMRAFHVVRSRNFISILSTLTVFALTVAYVSFENSNSSVNEDSMVNLFQGISGMAGKFSSAFPVAVFSVKAAAGEAVNLLYALAIGIAVLVLLGLCSKALYFQAALGMTDANGRRGPVKESTMRKQTARVSPYRTLKRREIKQIFRTPSLITNGYLYSIVLPFLVLVPLATKILDSVRQSIEESGGTFSLQMLRDLAVQANVPAYLFVIGGSLFCMLMASMAVGMSTLSRFLISREGKDFYSLKAMPVSARMLVTVKRNVVLLFNGISGFLLPALLLIALAVFGVMPWWVSAVCVLDAFAWLILFVDICANVDVKKPNLNWDNESVVTKNNMVGLIIFIVALVALVAAIFLCMRLTEDSSFTLLTVIAAVCGIAPVIAAAVCEISLNKNAEKLYRL